jgi:hypothetical protein
MMGTEADAVELMDDRGQPKAPWRQEGDAEKLDERANHGRHSERLRAGRFDAAANIRQTRQRPGDPLARRGRASIGLAHVLNEVAEPLGQPDQRHLARTSVAAHQAFQNPGAECVELPDLAHVDFEFWRFVRARVVDDGLETRDVVGGPGSRSRDQELAGSGCANDETLQTHVLHPFWICRGNSATGVGYLNARGEA